MDSSDSRSSVGETAAVVLSQLATALRLTPSRSASLRWESPDWVRALRILMFKRKAE